MAHRLLIVAGESSGDLHGAHLAKALRQREPDIELAALGGPAMAEAGVQVHRDATAHAAIGITEVLGSLRTWIRIFRGMVRFMDEWRPDAVVLIDSPEFNLRFAKRVRQRGIPCVYYISPQLWAWRAWRVRTVRRCVDRMLVILPFEQDFYARHGVDARFVGHPLVDVLADYRHDKAFAERLGLPPDRFLLGLLPGSRRKEIRYLLDPMLGAAERLDRELGGITVATAPAPNFPAEDYEAWRERTAVDLHFFPGRTYELMAAADLLLVSSGTATLEAGLIGTPMIVPYAASWVSYRVAKALVRTIRFFSLPNLVADRQVVPELLQSEVTGRRIADEALALIRSDGLEEMAQALASEVRAPFGPPGATGRAADEVLSLLHDPPPNCD
ncbi:MAG: lipid-A-disaccharide synthase [Planctomycetota bacterium]